MLTYEDNGDCKTVAPGIQALIFSYTHSESALYSNGALTLGTLRNVQSYAHYETQVRSHPN